jgi:hypothetical protein
MADGKINPSRRISAPARPFGCQLGVLVQEGLWEAGLFWVNVVHQSVQPCLYSCAHHLSVGDAPRSAIQCRHRNGRLCFRYYDATSTASPQSMAIVHRLPRHGSAIPVIYASNQRPMRSVFSTGLFDVLARRTFDCSEKGGGRRIKDILQ